MNNRQRAFVYHYIETWNATEAARRAGYSPRTARQMGAENLSKPYIREEIDRLLSTLAMSGAEVLARLGDMARADIGQYVNEGGGIDWAKVKERGYLVKSVSLTEKGERIELHDAQSALVWIGKHHKLFTERVEVEGDILVKVDR